ncbi:phage holin [Acetobacterium tundrae]|uniref:Holin n=1 Tax=Acetobacterium tundrae TaxID=132932 RepID=A0ABR6WNE6_9FIRM|nr:phage holin [Acetobacterium tundrae]MBC3798009.1 hypothetical protein [Acetobacterium tundrae]
MINWKIKVQNSAFWITIILGVFGIIGTYFGVSGSDMTTWKAVTDTLGAAIACPYVLGMIAWFVLSQFFDFGTLGFKDSVVTRAKIALSQTAEDIIKEQLTKESEEAKEAKEAKEAAVENKDNTLTPAKTEKTTATEASPTTVVIPKSQDTVVSPTITNGTVITAAPIEQQVQ